MRGLIEGLQSPCPIVTGLPAIYQEDPFTGRLTAAFDDVLASVILTLDNLDAYVDPALAPRDFVEWLAGWVGFPIGETWPEDRSRELVARAVELYRWRGTVKGLRDLLAVYTGIEPEVVDTGSVTWRIPSPGQRKSSSRRSGGHKEAKDDRPAKGGGKAEDGGPATPHLLVRVRVADPGAVDVRQLEALILAAKPAHVPHTLEVRK